MKKICLLLATIIVVGNVLCAQDFRVTGTVTDAANEPLVAASVHVLGTQIFATTDMDGKYAIPARQGQVLEFMYVGYKTKTLTVGMSNVIDVIMEEDAQLIGEVVVTALGMTREKKSLGYATQEVKADKLDNVRQADLNNALVGKVAGVRFMGGGLPPSLMKVVSF